MTFEKPKGTSNKTNYISSTYIVLATLSTAGILVMAGSLIPLGRHAYNSNSCVQTTSAFLREKGLWPKATSKEYLAKSFALCNGLNPGTGSLNKVNLRRNQLNRHEEPNRRKRNN